MKKNCWFSMKCFLITLFSVFKRSSTLIFLFTFYGPCLTFDEREIVCERDGERGKRERSYKAMYKSKTRKKKKTVSKKSF